MVEWVLPDNFRGLLEDFIKRGVALDSGILGAAFSDLFKLMRDTIQYSKPIDKHIFLQNLEGRLWRAFVGRAVLLEAGSAGMAYTTPRCVRELLDELPFIEELFSVIRSPAGKWKLRDLLWRLKVYQFRVHPKYRYMQRQYARFIEAVLHPLSVGDFDRMLESLSVKIEMPSKIIVRGARLSPADKEVGSLAIENGLWLLTADKGLAEAVAGGKLNDIFEGKVEPKYEYVAYVPRVRFIEKESGK